MSQQKVHTGSKDAQHWNFDVPPVGLRGSKMQLLTIGCVSVTGVWQGNLGQYYTAWAPLLKIPKVTNGFNERTKHHHAVNEDCDTCADSGTEKPGNS